MTRLIDPSAPARDGIGPQPPPPPPIASHCCKCTELGADGSTACTHVPRARVLCPEHGAGLVGVEVPFGHQVGTAPTEFPIPAGRLDNIPDELDLPNDYSRERLEQIRRVAMSPEPRPPGYGLGASVFLPICSSCGEYVVEPGGLLFSPPEPDGRVTKQHLCRQCHGLITRDFVDV